MMAERQAVRIKDGVTIDLRELRSFLIDAKRGTYAAGGKEQEDPQRPGHKELVYQDGLWSYRDSYAGSFSAPGVETVYFNGVPAWFMAYSGGIDRSFWGQKQRANEIFSFLRKALARANIEMPYRGPDRFNEGSYDYFNSVTGDILRFSGRERIEFIGLEVFSQEYIGGVYVHSDV